MGADQSLQTPEEHQKSLEKAKAQKEQHERNKLMVAADKKNKKR